MTPIEDTRVIHEESGQYNAELVRRADETDDLAYFLVRFRGAPVPFEPGQYMTIGVFADGKLVQRPYSIASSPRTSDEGYEFYIRLVPILRFTSLLWRLPAGHPMRMTGPKGRFQLEPGDDRTHLFIATGTGIAPFVSMIRTDLYDGTPRRTIVAHGVSYARELGYRQLFERWEQEGLPITYVPTISRSGDPANAGWKGRTGRVETILDDLCLEHGLTPERTVAYICGNPEMILKAEAVLRGHGLPEPHVKKELYWPKGKDPGTPAVGGAGEVARPPLAELAARG
jgi:ferredoxin--NADP+ reductase